MPHTQYSRQSRDKWGRREVDVMMEEAATQKDGDIVQKWNEYKIATQNFLSLVDMRANTRIFLLFALLVLFRPLYFPPVLLSSHIRSYFTRDIYRTFLIRATAYPAFKPAVVLQATWYVNYYANKQCETSVPTSHKTTRIPSDFRVLVSLSNDYRLLHHPPPFV